MSVGFVALNVVTSGNMKKQLILLLATMSVIIALPFAAVFSMGGSVLSFLSNVPSLAAAESQGFYTGGHAEGNTYAWGNCTYWVYSMRHWAGYPIPTSWGNANTWDDRAWNDGYEVNNTPAVGAIFQTDSGEFGHVAYVIHVDSMTGEFTISEMNVLGLNIVSKRTFSKDAAISYSFIHGMRGAQTWNPQDISLPSLSSGLL
ncbi:CHAP domain-containing protein [Candidatus Nomurabacteria bacterium]|nr:CHAP domain-containing protein [Candidatus Nomurabacteria bacterium]